MLDRDGHVAEATADNIFIVTERAVVTPPTSTNLRGITRETILQLADGAGDPRPRRTPFALFDLWSAREAFMCGTDGRSRADCVGRRPDDRQRHSGAHDAPPDGGVRGARSQHGNAD